MKKNSIIRNAGKAIALAAAALFIAQPLSAADKEGAVNMADANAIKKAAIQGKAEVKIAELGAAKAEHAEVKALATKLVAHHTAMNTEIAALAAAKGVDLTAANDPDAEKTVMSLEKESGKDFDKAFLNAVQETHEECIDAFEEQSKDAKDGEWKAWVDKSLPMVRAHHEAAEALEEKL
ncbi:DUF4142 domain-containing protein [Phragmitibacter flavus]|nr:DUF4142 domain-containing protein [Phragmitibacter flavus]